MKKFLVDENAGFTIVQYLRDQGFDTKFVRELYLSRDDIFIMEKAYQEERIRRRGVNIEFYTNLMITRKEFLFTEHICSEYLCFYKPCLAGRQALKRLWNFGTFFNLWDKSHS